MILIIARCKLTVEIEEMHIFTWLSLSNFVTLAFQYEPFSAEFSNSWYYLCRHTDISRTCKSARHDGPRRGFQAVLC